MANCPTLQSIDVDKCGITSGGLKLKLYIFPSEYRKSMTANVTDWVVDSLEYVDNSTPVLPVSITYHRNTANFEENAEGTIETATQSNTVTISITVNNRQYKKSQAISILGASLRELDLIVSQNNGTNWFIPNAILTVANSNSGTLKSDGSNYVLTFVAELDQLQYGIESTDVETLISTGSFNSIVS